ncbi:winged helix-turn-helix domain-containing protein [Arsukibacterium ikkense]|uniref:winged helix-turn-helix domain-containing protein n=1 Tax=Arsukibacterium ikkense TaxID=336831 RepID=UPI0013792CA8|nr:winged helix-turn-helix domain-containing protein [Arsukibacterium ikkense]
MRTLKLMAMQLLGPWRINVENFCLEDDNSSLELERLLFNLLRYFLANSQRVIPRQELVEQVWQQGFVDDNAINRAISDLRKALQHPGLTESPLKTHHRKGYSLQWSEQLQRDFAAQHIAAVVPPTAGPEANTSEPPALIADTSPQSANKKVLFRLKRKRNLFAPLLLICAALLWLWQAALPDAEPVVPAEVATSERGQASVSIQHKLTWQKGIEYNLALSSNQQLLAYNHTFNSKANSLKVRPYSSTVQQDPAEITLSQEGYSLFVLGWQPEQQRLLVRLNKDDMSYCAYQLYDFTAFPQYKSSPLDLACDPVSRNVAQLNRGGDQLYRIKPATEATGSERLVIEHLKTGQTELLLQPRSSGSGAGIVDFALSPDGFQLAYLHLTDRVSGFVYLYNLVSAEQQQLASFKQSGNLINISWNQSGSHLYAANGPELISISVADKQLKKRAFPKGHYFGKVQLTGERQAIASNFSAHTAGKLGGWHMAAVKDLFVAEQTVFSEFSQDTGSVGIVQVNPKQPQQLAYSANKGNGWQLWLRNNDKDIQLTTIADGSAAINNLDWSADGRQLVFGYQGSVWLYDLIEQNLRKLSHAPEFNFPVFEPDGTSIVVQRHQNNQSHLWRIDIGSGQLQQLSLQQATQPHFDQGKLYYRQEGALYQFVDGARNDIQITDKSLYQVIRMHQGWLYQFNQATGWFSRYPLDQPTQLEQVLHQDLIQSGLPMFFTVNPHQPQQMFVLSIRYPAADLYHIKW